MWREPQPGSGKSGGGTVASTNRSMGVHRILCGRHAATLGKIHGHFNRHIVPSGTVESLAHLAMVIHRPAMHHGERHEKYLINDINAY